MNYLEQLKITDDILINIPSGELTREQISLVLQALNNSGYKIIKEEKTIEESKELPKSVYLKTTFFWGKATLQDLTYVDEEGNIVLQGKSVQDLLKKVEKHKTRH